MAEDANDDEDRPFGEALLAVAEDQLAHGHFGLAVVIAQTVIEARTEIVFWVLFGMNVPRSQDTLMALLPDRSFAARATRTLWTDLTGDDIKEPRDEWRAYWKHLERRNQAAHGAVMFSLHAGREVTREGAEASLHAVRNMDAHIERVALDQIELMKADPDFDYWRGLRALDPSLPKHPE